MSSDSSAGRRLLRLATALLLAGCAGAASAHGGVQHGDHMPHHGGAVMMYKTLHYEVVLLPAGGVQLWLTDEARADLPASVVSDVAVEIERPDGSTEAVEMSISPGGDFWTGASRPVTDGKSTVRVAFVFQGEPMMVNLPGSYWPSLGKPAPAKQHGMDMEHGAMDHGTMDHGAMEHHGH